MSRAKKAQEQVMHQPGDAYIVLKTGDAFRKVSDPFRQRMSALPLEESKREADKDKGGMIAAATCLAFAVELYIKALRMLNRLGPERTHDLDELYSDLPNDLRRSIEERYNAGMGTSSRAFVVNITHKDATSQERMKKLIFEYSALGVAAGELRVDVVSGLQKHGLSGEMLAD